MRTLLGTLLLVPLFVSSARAAPLGQWVWTRADSAPLAGARARRADVAAAVNVAELRWQGGALRSELRLSPHTVPGARVITVRIHDALGDAFSLSDAELAAHLGDALERVLGVALASAPEIDTLQLDYDCPVERLPRYAALLRALHQRGVLRGRALWVTSLVAHLREAAYGSLFRDLVAGHVLQLFDTGERASDDTAAAVARLTERAGIPYALGLGVFERGLSGGRRTDHAAFWALVPALARGPLYRGTWVFPAGKPWAERLGGLP